MKSNKVISKKLLKKFWQKRRLTSVVDFLRFIKRKKNLQDFCRFLHKHSRPLPLPPSTSGVLFHGTQSIKNTLIPRNSMGRGDKLERVAYIYATDDPNYAIFLAILRLKNGSASVNATAKNAMLVVDLDFVNGPSTLENGYVHVVTTDGFKKTRNREHRANRRVNVLFTIPVTPADLTVPIYIQTEP